MTTDRTFIPEIIDAVLDARERLIDRGLSWLEADLIAGCALGCMLAGGGGRG